jgi:hypothetical protein
MNFRRRKRRVPLKIVLGASIMISLSACRDVDVATDAEMKMEVSDGDCGHDVPVAERQIIQAVRSRNRPFRFGGRDYTVTLFRRGDRFFLHSRIEPGYELGACALKELGKDVVISKPGLVFENDRMTVEYRDSVGKRRKACVPFGDVYGSIHTSEMPPFIPDQYPESEKYEACGALKRDEAVIESCIPTLQELLRRDDAETLSGVMVYPLLAEVDSDLVFVKDRKEFVELYPRIFTPTRKRAILKLKNTDVLCNHEGLWAGSGLWFCIANNDKPYFYCLFFSYDKVLRRRLANRRSGRR